MSHKSKGSPRPSPRNTLLNYFTKSAVKENSNKDEKSLESKKSKFDGGEKIEGKKLDFGKRMPTNHSSDEDDIFREAKKRKIISISEDEGSENINVVLNSSETVIKPLAEKRSHTNSKEKTKTKKAFLRTSHDDDDDKDEQAVKVSKQEEIKLATTSHESEVKLEHPCGSEAKLWIHETFEFLQPENIRDANKNRPNHPEYDASTLYVPEDFKKQQTPGHRQWWTLRAKYADCILFFKVGKFYELYHQDAVIGVQELGLAFMGKGKTLAHSGFPESAYDKMATTLVDRGYKVARVEQTETPQMMEKRCEKEKTKSKYDKVVKREVCQITNIGTQVFSTGQCSMMKGQLTVSSNFLLVLAEEKITSTTSRYGITFVDTSIGDFTLGEFDDDVQCSRLLTLLSLYPPVLILHERTNASEHTARVFKGINALKEKLINEKQFWNGKKAFQFLAETVYKSENNFPKCLLDMRNSKLALKSLGGCLFYLNRNLIDEQILPMATFKQYFLPDELNLKNPIEHKEVFHQKHMILDAITLQNLNINSNDNSLFLKLDYCCTQFGKRLLMEYVSSPCCDYEEIISRQEAVKELYQNSELLANVRCLLNSLSIDLERSLSRIHILGNKNIMQNHPNSRAILYESETYGKNKIIDFSATLDAIEKLMKLPGMFKDCNSKMLKMLTQTEDGNFLDMSKQVAILKSSFDIDKAKVTGFIVPERSSDKEYDGVLNEIEALEREVSKFLKEQEKIIGCKLNYFGNDRKRYQIEVPESFSKRIPDDYVLENSKGKGKNAVNRYTSSNTKDFLKRMQELEEKKKHVLEDFGRKIFEKFSTNYIQYKKLVNLTAKLDVLASLAQFSCNIAVCCVPKIFKMAKTPGECFIKLKNSVHPLMNSMETFIPNTIDFGQSNPNFVLFEGPNMGGKSTLMRQIALLSVLAQIGSLVPCEEMSMTLVDRIFTRLGASDNIMQNQSTFLVELNETALILKHCTFNSLVLLDELGRGTSTYDGIAIARAVAEHLAESKCRTLFSTHYHTLVDEFQDDRRIFLGHMACMLENENCEDITKENVTFLYKFSNGSCPRSFGFHAAKLGGISKEIIRRAFEISKKVEAKSLRRRITAKIIRNIAHQDDIEKLVAKLIKC